MLYEVRNLCKSFKGETIIDNFSMDVDAGEFVAILSKRGRGMTTLIQMLCGILKKDSGEIYYNEKAVGKMGMNRLCRKSIAYIPTEPILVPDMTVYDNMLIAMSHMRGNDKMKKKIAKDILKTIGLKGRGRFYPRELNIYEKQLVCIGRAIIKEPDIIFCDEPSDVLEGYAAEQLMQVLETLNEAGYTIVMTTHSERIAGLAHRIVPIEGQDIDELVDGEEPEEELEEGEEAEAEEEELDEELDGPADEADEEAEETDEEEAEETAESEEDIEDDVLMDSGEPAADLKEDDFSDFDEIVAKAAYAALSDGPGKKTAEEPERKLSKIDAEEPEDEEEDEFSYDDYSGYMSVKAADYDPDEEFEDYEDEEAEAEEDDIWNELKTRKSRMNARRDKGPKEEDIPELDLSGVFKNKQ